MSKTQKRRLIIAAFLTLLGTLLFGIAFWALDFDFAKISTQNYETNTYELGEDFDSIRMDVATANVSFALSDNGKCKIECFEQEKLKHSVTVRNRTLVIDRIDTRKWWDHMGINLGREAVTVYLPRTEYDSLRIDSDIGGAKLPEGFSFHRVQITTDLGDIVCHAQILEQAEFQTDTGSIRLAFARVKGSVSAKTAIGKIFLSDLRCGELSVKTDIGDILLKNVIAAGTVMLESDTGDVALDRCDAGEITIKTDTGDITGTLLSDKLFYARSSIGDVDIPKPAAGGKCELTTDTGDIQIAVLD